VNKVHLSTRNIAFFKEVYSVDLVEIIKHLNKDKNYEIVITDDGIDWVNMIKESDEMYRRETEC
jgi:hypothetical protein